MSGLPSTNIELLVVYHSGMAGSTTGRRTMQFRLCPVCRLQIEHNDVGEVLSMLILTAEHEELVSLPKACGMAHPYARYVAIVVYEVPLARNQVQAKDMVVDYNLLTNDYTYMV